jgi:hypothetical protein
LHKMKSNTREEHVRITRLDFSARELREFIVKALKRRGVDTDGRVSLRYEGCDFHCTSSAIGGGPSLYVTIERDLNENQ